MFCGGRGRGLRRVLSLLDTDALDAIDGERDRSGEGDMLLDADL